jgi:hypothetical protein
LNLLGITFFIMPWGMDTVSPRHPFHLLIWLIISLSTTLLKCYHLPTGLQWYAAILLCFTKRVGHFWDLYWTPLFHLSVSEPVPHTSYHINFVRFLTRVVFYLLLFFTRFWFCFYICSLDSASHFAFSFSFFTLNL